MRFYAKLNRRGRLTLWFVTVALIFLVISLTVYGIFALIVSSDSDSGTIVFKYGTGSRKDKSYEAQRSLYCPRGVYYVNFSLIAQGCDFSVSGDEDEIRYIIEAENGQYDTVTFYYGSREISVNGTHFMLTSAVQGTQNALLVPAEFITLCMNGVTVETTSKQITVVYTPGAVSLKPDIKPIDPIQL